MNQWYVVKTKPLKEDHVAMLLRQAHFAAFNPKIHDTMYRTRFASTRIAPLFPTYLFLNIDFDDTNNIRLVKYTRGVSKILCAEHKPIAIDQQIIATIQSRCNATGIIERQTHLKKGDHVRVKKGLLKDLIGIIEKPMPAEERVCVLLGLINYQMRATLHWTEVEKLHAA